jgi:hypothetical protein
MAITMEQLKELRAIRNCADVDEWAAREAERQARVASHEATAAAALAQIAVEEAEHELGLCSSEEAYQARVGTLRRTFDLFSAYAAEDYATVDALIADALSCSAARKAA